MILKIVPYPRRCNVGAIQKNIAHRLDIQLQDACSTVDMFPTNSGIDRQGHTGRIVP